MNVGKKILFPVGRLVAGSLYVGNTVDSDGEPLLFKTGARKGQPRTDYIFAVAILKGAEKSWQETAWGREMAEAAVEAWPQGQHVRPDFSWKVQDGDSSMPSGSGGKAPAEYEHNRGSWVVWFFSTQKPLICDANGSKYLPEPGLVARGYYVQVQGSYSGNGSPKTPGMYLGPDLVAFSGYGEEISSMPALGTVKFGGSLPPGASKVPLSAHPVAPAAPAAPAAPPPPPPPPQEEVVTMTEQANGITYAQFLAGGWTLQQLREVGYAK